MDPISEDEFPLNPEVAPWPGDSGNLSAVRGSLREGAADAGETLRAALVARRDAHGDHTAWGRLCEEAGEAGLALGEYQRALRDDPDDVTALARLAVLYEERGDLDHAIESAERWARLGPGDAQAVRTLVDLLVVAGRFERAREVVAALPGEAAMDPASPSPATAPARGLRQTLEALLAMAERVDDDEPVEAEGTPAVPTDADAVRFAHLFAGRENVYARQWTDRGGEGGYSPVREPFTPQVARNHLLGSVTVGVYPVRLDDTVTFFALDVDITKRALARARGSVTEARRLKDLVGRAARRLQTDLAGLGVPALLEDSGYKGRHLWVFLDQPEAAAVVRAFAALFVATHPTESVELHVEFFPKQASAGAGVGNLIKLPLGIHRRTGRRSRLLRPDGSAEPDPHGALRRQPRLGPEALRAAMVTLKARALTPADSDDAAAGSVGGEPSGEDAPRDLSAFPAPPPPWTSADFETNPEVSQILRHCPVLDALRRKTEAHRRLTHEEQVVLAHSLGHSGAGALAVNYLLDLCIDVPPGARLQTPLSGNPISCPKIRKRIPQVTGSVRCNCLFDFAPERYPTPRLHLLRPAPPAPAKPAPPRWDPADRVRSLRVLRVRLQEIQAEISALEGDLVRYMEQAALEEILTEDGALRLVQEEGMVAALMWEPTAPSGSEAARLPVSPPTQ